MRIVPDWDKYFMDIAIAVSKRSKDPATQVGAIIVDQSKHIVGTGYNGMAPGTLETPELWERPTKYLHVRHSERNAIEHSTKDLNGSIIYCTMHPCANCASLIAKAGITEVYYLDDKYRNDESEAIFKEAAIKVTKLTS